MNILQTDDQFRIFNSARILDTLPKGTYTFESSMTGPYLLKGDFLRIPSKVYSNDKIFVDHITHTWNTTTDSLGILLSGKKGLGKSFTANLLCATLGKELPIIKITREVHKGEGLIDFLNEIKQDHVIYIDEFEKIFNMSEHAEEDRLNQKVFLSFLDGINTTSARRLFIITANREVDDLFINRPSRLRYIRDYEGLSIEVVKEIIDDRLESKEFLEDLITNVDHDTLNIDILIKIIDEINLHKVPYSEFKTFFNYKSDNVPFEVIAQLPDHSGPVQVDAIDTRNLVMLKSGLRTSWNFDSYSIGSNYYDFDWNRGAQGPIEKIDSNTYKMNAICTVSTLNGDKELNKFPTVLIFRKQVRHLIF